MMALFQVLVILTSVSMQAFGQRCKVTTRPEYGVALVGHVFRSFSVDRLATCYSACNVQPACQSLNFNLADKTCQFNKETKHTRPANLESKETSVYAENPDRALLGSVFWKAAKSCQHIAKNGEAAGDGEYWVDPQGNGKAFKVFCDMTTDGGGWLLVANFVIQNPATPSNWITPATKYRGISHYGNRRMGITNSAMTQLRAHAQFNQLRFHCSKKKGTTFHVKTTLDGKGEAVVRFFSGETDVLPGSCNSFIRMEGDTSRLAAECANWGNDYGHYVGKWGHFQKVGELRLHSYPAFVANKYHWIVELRMCDDKVSDNLSSGDFWKIYVR